MRKEGTNAAPRGRSVPRTTHRAAAALPPSSAARARCGPQRNFRPRHFSPHAPRASPWRPSRKPRTTSSTPRRRRCRTRSAPATPAHRPRAPVARAMAARSAGTPFGPLLKFTPEDQALLVELCKKPFERQAKHFISAFWDRSYLKTQALRTRIKRSATYLYLVPGIHLSTKAKEAMNRRNSRRTSSWKSASVRSRSTTCGRPSRPSTLILIE